jgi:hypothetical protein
MATHQGIAVLLGFFLSVLGLAGSAPADQDQDGLPDEFEQALLARFVPAFHISPSDCDVAPAEFLPGTTRPIAKAKNGTIYGQVFPIVRADGHHYIELHYYHLWTRDCGRPGHILDTESLSALLRSDFGEPRPEKWTAVFWYAAAHENTLCDMSNGGPAAALNAVDHGPEVWISEGKHASFLNKDLCSLGCGNDRCEPSRQLPIFQIVNLGEPGVPMNGAEWMASPTWPLATKMKSDFTDPVIGRLSAMNGVDVIPARDLVRGTRTTVKVAARTYLSMTLAVSDTESAIADGKAAGGLGAKAGVSAMAIAADHVASSTRTALWSVNRSIRHALGWTKREESGKSGRGWPR